MLFWREGFKWESIQWQFVINTIMKYCIPILKKIKIITLSSTEKVDLKKGFRMFSLIWPTAIQIYCNKRKCFIKKLNSHRIGLGHQHGFPCIVLQHQNGCHDAMWKHCIYWVNPERELAWVSMRARHLTFCLPGLIVSRKENFCTFQ